MRVSSNGKGKLLNTNEEEETTLKKPKVKYVIRKKTEHQED